MLIWVWGKLWPNGWRAQLWEWRLQRAYHHHHSFEWYHHWPLWPPLPKNVGPKCTAHDQLCDTCCHLANMIEDINKISFAYELCWFCPLLCVVSVVIQVFQVCGTTQAAWKFRQVFVTSRQSVSLKSVLLSHPAVHAQSRVNSAAVHLHQLAVCLARCVIWW